MLVGATALFYFVLKAVLGSSGKRSLLHRRTDCAAGRSSRTR